MIELVSSAVENWPTYPPFTPGDGIPRTGWHQGDPSKGESIGGAYMFALGYPASDMGIGTYSNAFSGNKIHKFRRWRYRIGKIILTVSNYGIYTGGGSVSGLQYWSAGIPGDIASWAPHEVFPSINYGIEGTGTHVIDGAVSPWFEYDLTAAELPLLRVSIACSSRMTSSAFGAYATVSMERAMIEIDDDMTSLFLTRNSAVKLPDPPTKLCKWGY